MEVRSAPGCCAAAAQAAQLRATLRAARLAPPHVGDTITDSALFFTPDRTDI